jgi:hypothetical protein
MLTNRYKNQHVRTGFLKILAIVIVTIVLCGAFLYAIFHADFLAVREFKVAGLRVIPQNIFLEAMKLESASHSLGLLGTDRLLNWRSGEEQILVGTNEPYLADVKTEVEWLKRTVNFLATERKTSFIWCKSGSCLVTDEMGRAFALAPTYQGHLITEIQDERVGGLEVGFEVFKEAKWWEVFKQQVSEIKSFTGLERVKILAEETREWQAFLPGGGVLKFSLDNPPEDLPSVLSRLSKDVDLKKMEYADFRVPGRVYFK